MWARRGNARRFSWNSKENQRNLRDDPDRRFLKFHIKKCSKFSLTGELKMPKKSQQLISGQLWTTKDAKEISQSFLSMTEIPRHRFPWGFYPGSPMQQERPRIFWISHGFPPKINGTVWEISWESCF